MSFAYNIIHEHSLILSLIEVNMRQVLLLKNPKYPVYIYKDQDLVKIIEAEEDVELSRLQLKGAKDNHSFFVHPEDRELIRNSLNDKLVNLSRRFSSTDQLKNSIVQSNLLSLQMESLYQDPYNDALLKAQFQNASNFSQLLMKNLKNQKEVFHQFNKQPHHYTVAQPMLSSILLLSFLQHKQYFTSKEINDLFITSFFKDFGMSYVSKESLQNEQVSEKDKNILITHGDISKKLLEGRVPLTKEQLRLIGNHHLLSAALKSPEQKELLMQTKPELLTGFESTIIAVIDILVAMTNPRPYRDALSLFEALNQIRDLMQDDYPQEFKFLVKFLKHFFNK